MMTKSKSKANRLLILFLLIPLLTILTLSFNKMPIIDEDGFRILEKEMILNLEQDTPAFLGSSDTLLDIEQLGDYKLSTEYGFTILTDSNQEFVTKHARRPVIVAGGLQYSADSAIIYKQGNRIHLMGNVRVSKRISGDGHVPDLYPTDTQYRISAPYGDRMHPIQNVVKFHQGIDIPAPKGSPVYASADGTVKRVEHYPKAGRFIVIDHGAVYSTMYSQLSEQHVQVGDNVKRGDVIGKVGSSGVSTGPHLHFEVMKDGEHVNPEDYVSRK